LGETKRPQVFRQPHGSPALQNGAWRNDKIRVFTAEMQRRREFQFSASAFRRLGVEVFLDARRNSIY
jgi:hypothetical protein